MPVASLPSGGNMERSLQKRVDKQNLQRLSGGEVMTIMKMRNIPLA